MIDAVVVKTLQARVGAELGLGSAAAWSIEDVATLVCHAGADTGWLKRALKRRLMGEPLAYVTGEFEFEGRRFAVDARAYITDPEAKWLVCDVIREVDAWHARSGRWPVVAEFGFGAGALGITVKLERPGIRLVALDIDGAALAVGRENLARHSVEATVVESDGFDGWPWTEPPDLVFADPPWGSEEDLYDERRGAGHYHAMPAASAYPVGGVASVHRFILAALAGRGWRTRLVLNLGVLPEAEVAGLRGLVTESELVYPTPTCGVLRIDVGRVDYLGERYA